MYLPAITLSPIFLTSGRPELSQRYLNEKNNFQNYMENNPFIMLKNKTKGKLHQVPNFIGIIVHLSKFCISTFMNDREIIHFKKIHSVILEFKMSSMVKVLWKLVET